MLQTLRRTYLDIFREYPVMVPLAALGACVGTVYALINTYALPLYLRGNLGLSTVVIGWLASTFLAAEMLMKFPLGRLSDHIGRRPLIATGPAVSCITALIIAALPGAFYLLLFPLRAIDGMALAAVWPAVFALVGDKVPKASRGAAMSVLYTIYMGCQAVGPALGGLLTLVIVAPWARDRAAFFLASAVLLVAVGIARFGLPAQRPTELHAAVFAGENAIPYRRVPVGRMALILFITAVQLLALMLLQPFLAIYAREVMHLSRAQIPLVFLLPALALAPLGLPLGRLSDRWGKVRSVRISLALAAVAMAALPLSTDLAAVIAIVFVLMVAYLLGAPAWLAFVADLAPVGAYGSTLGAVATAQGVGATLGPILGGHLWALDYHYAFWASAVLLALCSALAFAFLPGRGRPGVGAEIGENPAER